MSEVAARLPHAILDRDSRLLKAQKIAELVSASAPLAGASVLDVGTGSGDIASALAERVGEAGSVWSVDVLDQRRTAARYSFRRVDGVELPFEDASFDIVVSNHVIEHVGGRRDQARHLAEVRRVLRDGGVCYLAVPSRWGLVEPHFRLPFLSWLPRRLRSPYVRLARRGARYDCELLTRGSLRRLGRGAGLALDDRTFDALQTLVRIEPRGRLRRFAAAAPGQLGRLLVRLSPTIVVLLRPERPATGTRGPLPRRG